MYQKRILLCFIWSLGLLSLPYTGLTAQTGTSEGSSKTSVENTESVPDLHRVALEAYKNDQEKEGTRAVKKIIKKVNEIDGETYLNELMGDHEERIEKLADVLVKQKKRMKLARRYFKALLTNGSLFSVIANTHSGAIRKAFEGRRAELFNIVRSYRGHGSAAFQLMDRKTMVEILRKRLTDENTKAEANRRDVRFLAWMAKRSSAWYKKKEASERLSDYRDLLKKSIDQYPDMTVLQWRLGDVYYLMETYKKATRMYRKVMKTPFGKEKNKIKDNSMFRVSLDDFEEREETLRYNTPPYLKLAASMYRSDRKKEAKRVIMRQLEELDPKFKTQTRLSVIIGLWRIGIKEKAVSMLREWFSSFLNASDEELKRKWLPVRWVSSRLYRYLRILDRPIEAFWVGKQSLRLTKDFGRGRSVRGLRLNVKKQKETLTRKIPQEIEQEFKTTYLKRATYNPSKKTRKKVRKLIDQLGAQSYEKRNKAYKKLKAIGPTSVAVLQKHKDHNNPEIRNRVNQLINIFARRHKMKKLRKKYGVKGK